MPRRNGRKKPTGKKKVAFNLLTAAQTYANTHILTMAAFRVNPITFFTGQETLSGTTTKKLQSGQTITQNYSVTGYLPELNGTRLTLPELMGFDKKDGTVVPFGGSQVGGMTTMEQIRKNIELNGGYTVPLIQTIGVNVGFTVAKRLLSKQRRGINKALKVAGLRKDVMV